MKIEKVMVIMFAGVILISGLVLYIMKDTGARVSPIPTSTSGLPQQNFTANSNIASLEDRLFNDPNNYDLLVQLGNSYYDIGNPAKSIEYYERSLKIRPANAHVLVDCGVMYRQAGNSEKAIEYFKKASKIDPNLPQAYYNTGITLQYDLKDYTNAIKAWENYLKIAPNLTPDQRRKIENEINQAKSLQ